MRKVNAADNKTKWLYDAFDTKKLYVVLYVRINDNYYYYFFFNNPQYLLADVIIRF